MLESDEVKCPVGLFFHDENFNILFFCSDLVPMARSVLEIHKLEGHIRCVRSNLRFDRIFYKTNWIHHFGFLLRPNLLAYMRCYKKLYGF